MTLIDLAEREGEGLVALKDIASRQGISEKYLESIVKILVSGGLIVGTRGKGGGYRLTRAPEDYSIGSVLRLTEGTLSPVFCVGADESVCEKTANCRMMPMWQRLDEVINEYLDSVSLSDLMTP